MYNAIIPIYFQNSRPNEAFALFRQLQESGLKPTNVTLLVALLLCALLGSLNLGMWIHEHVRKNGFISMLRKILHMRNVGVWMMWFLCSGTCLGDTGMVSSDCCLCNTWAWLPSHINAGRNEEGKSAAWWDNYFRYIVLHALYCAEQPSFSFCSFLSNNCFLFHSGSLVAHV